MNNLFQFAKFVPETKTDTSVNIDVTKVPKEMDVFYRDEFNFLPEGKKFEDLTPKEKQIIKDRYRFDPMRPGIYQAITGVKNMI